MKTHSVYEITYNNYQLTIAAKSFEDAMEQFESVYRYHTKGTIPAKVAFLVKFLVNKND